MITTLDGRVSRIQASKQGLRILSHALEDVLVVEGLETSEGVVVALFQRRSYFDHEAERYAQLAVAGTTVVVAFVGSADHLPAGVHGVALDEGTTLAGQWGLVVLTEHLGAALVVTDTGTLATGPSTLDASRMFTGGWTFDRSAAAAAARELVDLLGAALEDGVRARVLAAIGDADAQPLDPALKRAADVTQFLVSSIDQQLQRVARLNSALVRQRHQAEVDQLTGLHNRHFLARFLGGQLDAQPVAMTALLVDLDGLKGINDTYGHTAGDAAIVAVADSVRDCCRPGDIQCRVGGDEFLVLLPGVDLDAGLEVGNRIAERVARAVVDDPWSHLSLTVSIGVASASPAAIPMDALDRALYAGKRSGRGSVLLAT